MCGILGVHAKNFSNQKFLTALSLLHHRGPDNSGVLKISDELIFGHTRLSILDLSSNGNQPMQLDNGNYTISFNGEIYNFRELKDGLIRKGIHFFSNTDTEVILYLYMTEGELFVKRLNGIFAIAIYDKKLKSTFLYRDSLGVKPLYYYNKDSVFAFSSEIRSLKALGLPLSINYNSIGSYLELGSFAGSRTLYNEIELLKAGHFIVYNEFEFKCISFFEFDFTPLKYNYFEILESTRKIVEQSVSNQLVSDLPVGAFLSGGIDSSIVVALMRKLNHGTIKTFSLDFEEKYYSEGLIAKLVANHYGTEHYNFVISSTDFSSSFYNVLDSYDLPSIDGVNSFFVSKFAKEAGITVALSGLGGDELFGGYSTFDYFNTLTRSKYVISFLPSMFINILKYKLSYDRYMKLYDYFMNFYSGDVGTYIALRGVINPSTVKQIFQRDFFSEHYKDMVSDFNENKYFSPENKISFMEIRNYMLNQLLRDSDTMSMRHSLEVRVPLLDLPLLNFATRIPGKYKHKKMVLVDSFKDILPMAVYSRKKQGFSFPFEKWMRHDIRNDLKQLFFLRPDIFKEKEIALLWNGFEAKKVSWARIWSIVVLNYYLHKSEQNS